RRRGVWWLSRRGGGRRRRTWWWRTRRRGTSMSGHRTDAEEHMRQPHREPVGSAPSRNGLLSVVLAALILLTSCATARAAAPATGQKHFETPEGAGQALVDAPGTEGERQRGG